MKNRQLEHSDHKATFKKYPLCFLAHDIHSPVNIGSLFRIADALGVEKIYLSGTSAVPPNPKIKKTSRSAEKYVSHAYVDDYKALLVSLKESNYTLVGLEITSDSIDIKDFHLSENEKVCLIIGSERHGISQELLDEAETTIHIPMLGHNSSMNVANACSIAAYQITQKLESYAE